VPLPLTLALRADAAASRDEVRASTREVLARFRPQAAAARAPDPIVRPGDAARSLLVQRMATRDPRQQMPPLGTVLTDPAGLDLVRRWIADEAPLHTARHDPERRP